MDIDWYQEILADIGPSEQAQKVDPAYAETYRGRIPDWLIRFWVDHGWGSWFDGAFWLCDPALLQPVADAVFEGDPLFDSGRIDIFAYTAFGNMIGWHPEALKFEVDFNLFDSVIVSEDKLRRDKDGVLFSKDSFFGAAFPSEITEPWKDKYSTPMLPQAIERLGRLEPGEIYGYFPALKLGGDNVVDNLERVPIAEHLLFLSQLGRLTLREFYHDPNDLQNPFGSSRILRRLGPAA